MMLNELGLPALFVGASNLLVYLASRRRVKTVKAGVVSDIILYPVKSVPGVSVKTCRAGYKGLYRGPLIDRGFMFVQENGSFVSQRTHPQLANITIEYSESGLCLSAPGMDDLFLPFTPLSCATKMSVRVWSTSTLALDCGDEAAEWAQRFLELPGGRVVQAHPELTARKPVGRPQDWNITPEDSANFQDNTPVHIVSMASIQKVSDELEQPVDVRNFRPNILVTGDFEAFDEDNWIDIFIGSTRMHGMWLNERCKLTTVDPNVGKFRNDQQPLKYLKKSRTLPGHEMPCFGINAGVDDLGSLSVGDEVFVVRGPVP